MATIAEQIAERFDNDGQCFRANGEDLEDVCVRESGANHLTRKPEYTRYNFSDRSAMVVYRASWDVAIPGSSRQCFCWVGADRGRHQQDCPDVRDEGREP